MSLTGNADTSTRDALPPRWWWGDLFLPTNWHPVLAGIQLALITFGAGAILALCTGFLHVYLRSWAIWVGVTGIAWSATWCAWGRTRAAVLFTEIAPAFAERNEFIARASVWRDRVLSARLQITAGGVLLACALAYFLAMRDSTLPWLPPDWSSGTYSGIRRLILLVFAVPVALLAGTGAAVILTYSLAIWRLSRLPLRTPVSVGRVLVQPASSFGVVLGLAWSVGGGLFILLDALGGGIIAFIATSSVAGLGMLMLAVPELSIHLALLRAQRTALRRLLDEQPTDRGLSISERHERLIREADASTTIYATADSLSLVVTTLALPFAAWWVARALPQTLITP